MTFAGMAVHWTHHAKVDSDHINVHSILFQQDHKTHNLLYLYNNYKFKNGSNDW